MLPLSRLKKSNTIDNLWIYILALAQEKPIYAYYLPRDIKERFGFNIGKVTAYRVLYRLEKGKFVKSRVKDRRRVYQITKRGEKELQMAKEFYKNILEMLK